MYTWMLGGRVEEGTFPENCKWVCYQSQTWTVEQLSTQHQTVLVSFLGSESRSTAVQKECASPPHIQVCHCT